MDDDGIDRISSLPDLILEHILSFLSTKQALQTCILSKRWRNTWASVPALEFNTGEFLNYARHRYKAFEACKTAFEHFVDYVLDNREPMHLDRFQLKWTSCRIDRELVIKWLDCVLLLKPKLVQIRINANLHLLDSLFHCDSIQNLQLLFSKACIESRTKTKSINLPYLKFLRLDDIHLNDVFVTMLFQGCPILEDLALKRCELDLSEISSNMLKKLAINDCYCYQLKNLHISCPSLVNLVMAYYQSHANLSISYMPSLINAELSFCYPSNYDTLKLLCCCSNATRLQFVYMYLPCKYVPFKAEACDQLKAFNNLKSLRIGGWDVRANFGLIAYLLQHSPRLQELTLELNKWRYPLKEEINWKESSEVKFLREYLDDVIITNDRSIDKAKIDGLLQWFRARVSTIGKIIVDIPPYSVRF